MYKTFSITPLKYILLCIAFLLLWKPIFAQNSLTEVTLKAAFERNYKAELLQLEKEELPRKIASEFKDVYKVRKDGLIKRIENEQFIFDNEWLGYVNELTQEIVEANNIEFADQINVVISKNFTPNAFATGEGTIILNVGLLHRLESLEQLVFVLCHELSHFTLQHDYRTIYRAIEIERSADLKEKLAEISKSEHYRYSKTNMLYKEHLYSERSHSRELESEADSLGLAYYKNTKYNQALVPTTMDMLDKLDEPIIDPEVDIFDILGVPAVDYKTSTFLSGIVNEEEDFLHEDSITTHPDCKKRKEWLIKNILQEELPNTTTNEKFNDFVAEMQFEQLEGLLFYGRIDQATVLSLRMLVNNTESDYLIGTVAYCLYSIYWGRKEHRLTTITKKSFDSEDVSYAKILDYAYASRFNVLKNAAFEFCHNIASERQITDERFLYAYYKSALATENSVIADRVKNTFLSHYQSGDLYESIMKDD